MLISLSVKQSVKMISIDTNILVRAYLEDDIDQAKEAQQLLQKYTDNKTLFISSYAILEFAWVLKVKDITRKDIYQAISTLINANGTIIGQKEVVAAALDKYISGKADFGDYMILAESEYNNCKNLKTFDKNFNKELGLL